MVTLNVVALPGVVKSLPKVAVPPVTVTGTVKAVGTLPETSSVGRLAVGIFSLPLAVATEYSRNGTRVSEMESRKLPNDPASVVINCTRWSPLAPL